MRCRRFVDGCSTPSRRGSPTLRGMGPREAHRVLWPIEWRIHTRRFRQQIGCWRIQSSASSGAPMAEAARFGQRGDGGRSHVGVRGRSADAETRAHRIIQPNNDDAHTASSSVSTAGLDSKAWLATWDESSDGFIDLSPASAIRSGTQTDGGGRSDWFRRRDDDGRP